MPKTAPKRSTQFVALALFSFAFLYLNVDGYPTMSISLYPKALPDLEFYFGEPENSQYVDLNYDIQKAIGRNSPKITTIYWLHGWPFNFAARPSKGQIRRGNRALVRNKAGVQYYSRWPFDNAPPLYVSYHLLMANSMLFILLSWLIWRTSAELNLITRLTISKLLGVTFLVALTCRFNLINFRFTPHIVAWGLVFGLVSISMCRLRGIQRKNLASS